VEEHARLLAVRMRRLPGVAVQGDLALHPLAQRLCGGGSRRLVVRAQKEFDAARRPRAGGDPHLGQNREVLRETPLLVGTTVKELFDANTVHQSRQSVFMNSTSARLSSGGNSVP